MAALDLQRVEKAADVGRKLRGGPAVIGGFRRRTEARQVRADDSVVPREMRHPAGPGARGFQELPWIITTGSGRSRPRRTSGPRRPSSRRARTSILFMASRPSLPRRTLPPFCASRESAALISRIGACAGPSPLPTIPAIKKRRTAWRATGRNVMRRMGGVLLWLVCIALLGSPASAQSTYPQPSDPRADPVCAGRCSPTSWRGITANISARRSARTCWSRTSPAPPASSPSRNWRAKPDGYTIMVGNISTNCLTPVLLAKRMKYRLRPRRADHRAASPTRRCSSSRDDGELPAEDLRRVRRIRPKAHPKRCAMPAPASAPISTSTPKSSRERAGGLKMVHIPFKDGGAGILKDIAGGDTHVSWFNVSNSVVHDQGRQARPLAVAADERLPAWPDVPDHRRGGLRGLPAVAMVGGLCAGGRCARSSKSCTRRSSEAARTPGAAGDLRERAAMVAPVDKTAEDARAWLKNEMETWRRDIADAGISGGQRVIGLLRAER